MDRRSQRAATAAYIFALVVVFTVGACDATSAPVDAGTPASDGALDAASLGDAPGSLVDAPIAMLDAPIGADAGPPALACPFDAALQANTDAELLRQGISGVTLGIEMPGCTWISAAGLAERSPARAMVPNDRFRIASITKTFTAAVILLLVQEGRLALTDLLTTHVVFPGAEAVTIRHLLTHTSGIYDYYNSPVALADLGRPWTRAEVIDIARAQPLAFPPGTREAYSNTNFFLLGMIIEAVTGNAYHDEVRRRLLTPLGLSDTYVAGVESLPGEIAHGYTRTASFSDETYLVDPSLTWAAGGIVSTTPDIMVWTRALFAGSVLSPAMRTAMLTPEPLPGGLVATHGLGPKIQTLPMGLGRFYSHGGRLHGYFGLMGYLVDRDAVMVEQTNDTNGGPNPFMTQMWMAAGII